MKTTDTDLAFMRLGLIVIAFMFTYISPDSHATERGNMTKLVIVDKSTSNYVIVISKTASPSEKHAADELKSFLKEISGADLSIVTDSGALRSHEIILGDNLHLKQLNAEIDFDALGDDGFNIRTEGNYLIVAGGKQRGTMYGVYTFLEDYLGCRWFHPEVSRVPKRERIEIGAINDTQTPIIASRDTHYFVGEDADWAARNKINGHHAHGLTERHGGRIRFASPMYHTFYRLMPGGVHHGVQEYFKEHPEYYAEVNGERVGEYAQLCLTNPKVVRIAIETVKQWIREQPDRTIFTVSQNDYGGWCECENCHAADEREESHMGSLLQFVNQVAEAIEEEHPDKYISTLAYAYSRKPPKTVRPRHNVLVRLSDIECCFSHPLGTCTFSRNPSAPVSVVDDIKKWSEISDQLFIWDYVINFQHWLAPHPNLYVLKPNMQFFVKYGVKEMFPQADPFNPMGEFSELRAYLLAKLMWNPNFDVDKGVGEFLDAYYGSAARPILEYIDMLHKKATDERIHMTISAPMTSPLFSPDLMMRANALFDEAERLADDETVSLRVKVARLSIQYVEIITTPPDDPKRQALVDYFFKIADTAGISYLGEAWGSDPEHMKTRQGNNFLVWACSACGKPFFSFDSNDLAKRETAHRTLWCPKKGEAPPYREE